MTGCLRDRELFLLAADEGTAAAQPHLRSCLDCARRYQRLRRQLNGIEHTLRTTTPPAIPAPITVSRRYWIPLTATLAVALLLVWVNVWMPGSRQQSAQAPAIETVVESDWEAEWADTLLATEDELPIALPASVPSETYLQAATTEGEWPCEWQEQFSTPTCEIHPFPVILVMQSLEEVMYE